jgi:Domain of unknown function (DUF4159)
MVGLPRGRRLAGALVALALLLGLVSGALAQRRFGFRGDMQRVEPEVRNLAYDGRFTFARLRYTTAPGGFYYRGLPAWAHGYPTGELNLSKILKAVTTVDAHVDGGVVLAMNDPALFKYPVAYMTEAGFWELSDEEAAGLRAYLLKGGFLIFDDFRDDFRGGGWATFEANMQRVLPGARFPELAASHPIFHCFFDIPAADVLPQYYDRGRPIIRGLFQDNDPSKRLMAIVNFNTDVSNFWEFSETGYVPISLSNEAYKLGVNYIVYGLTH